MFISVLNTPLKVTTFNKILYHQDYRNHSRRESFHHVYILLVAFIIAELQLEITYISTK